MKVTIYCNRAIPWHNKRLAQFEAGLKQIGFFVSVTNSSVRINDNPAVLFGTSGFKQVEAVPGDWLLVDRAFWGDPDCVRLGWNGRGMAGDYKTDLAPSLRPFPKARKRKPGEKIILCGDYDSAPQYDGATHFKPHPQGINPTDLPTVDSFDDCKLAVVGESSVGVELRLKGIPVEFTDPDCMSAQPLDWLALTQWGWDEIEQGEPIRHLFSWLT